RYAVTRPCILMKEIVEEAYQFVFPQIIRHDNRPVGPSGPVAVAIDHPAIFHSENFELEALVDIKNHGYSPFPIGKHIAPCPKTKANVKGHPEGWPCHCS